MPLKHVSDPLFYDSIPEVSDAFPLYVISAPVPFVVIPNGPSLRALAFASSVIQLYDVRPLLCLIVAF